MSINDDLFLAILSMDAYNRGTAPGLANMGGTGSAVGNAEVIRIASDEPSDAIGFSATATASL